MKLLGAQIRLLQKNEDGADSIYSRSSRRSQGSRRSTTSSLVTKRAEVAAQAASLRIELENKAMEEKAELDLARAPGPAPQSQVGEGVGDGGGPF